MIRNILKTNDENWLPLFARIAIGIVIFAHGAQKMLGWYGGGGFNGTMDFFTGVVGLPTFIAFMVILTEFLAPLMLIFGIATRIAATFIAINFIGAIFFGIWENGFFMNWNAEPGQGEGLEFFVLLFGLVAITLIAGGGKASLDAVIVKNTKKLQPKRFN